MADVAVEFLLNNLGELAIHHMSLISGAEDEVKQLTYDLNYFKAYLKYASNKKIDDDRARMFVRQIREVVYNAEDVVDTFITQKLAKKSQKWLKIFIRKIFGIGLDIIQLDGIAQKVQRVRKEVAGVYGDLDLLLREIGDDGPDQIEVPRVRQENVVGFEDAAEEIIGYLNEETKCLDIISIIGMPGLGKSTLAGKIFRDPKIQYEFPTRLWVYVSKFTPKDVFLSILRELITITEDMHKMKAHELATKVSVYLERGKFLIVMDDVWSPEDWENVKVALPASNHLGKILITSRYVEVARSASTRRDPHMLRFLTKDESWELLQYEVFGEPKCDSELEGPGKIISDECKGLPLAIVVIGGILGKIITAKKDTPATRSAWVDVSKRVNDYLMNDPENMMEKIISLSYDRLPYNLKACFLYLAMFPQDIEIPAWKLFRMWIAEGFVELRASVVSPEETAESYLDELINRNLVRVDRRSAYGKVKSCRIHDSLRDFCRKKAGFEEENFLKEIRKSNRGALEPDIDEDDKYRRLCIHSDMSAFLSRKPSACRVRSLVCFSKDEVTLEGENVSTIPAGFKMLRVLDVKPIKFNKISSEMFDLLHLRHIHLSFELDKLPKAFSKLWNVQTLIVDTTQRTLKVEADIWKMCHLGYFKTNAIATLPKPTEASAEGESKIQMLGTISTENCTEKVFSSTCHLKRVSIRGPLKKLLEGKIDGCSFKDLMKLNKLEKLKLKNDVFPEAASEHKLPYLPKRFPLNLKILTLSDTFLEWSEIKDLASHKNLEVLKLKENAFTGNYWETNVVFEDLKVLFIDRTDLVLWKVSAHHFPKLKHLELHNCEKLREVPIEFVNIHSLKVMVLHYCGTAAVSANNILAEKMKRANADNKIEFKLSTLPPIVVLQQSRQRKLKRKRRK